MILRPRKKLITPRRLQRGNIVIHTEADPLFSQVTLQLSAEETAANNQIITPTVGATFTAHEASGGIAKVDSARFKYGSQSLLIDDEAGLMKAYWDTAADFPGGYFDADFTVEFDIYFAELNGAGRDIIGSWTFTEREWVLAINANSVGDFRTTMQYSGTGSNNLLGNQELWAVGNHPTGGALNTWHHIAFQREGNNWFTHADGFQVGSTRVSATAMNEGTGVFEIGGSQTSGPASEISVDNIRFTKGTARYGAGDFTPPSESFPEF